MKQLKLKDLRLSENLLGIAAVLKTIVSDGIQDVVYAIVGNDVILYWGDRQQNGAAISEMVGRIILENPHIQNLNIRICKDATLQVGKAYSLTKTYKSGKVETCQLNNPYIIDFLLNTRDVSGAPIAETRLAA